MNIFDRKVFKEDVKDTQEDVSETKLEETETPVEEVAEVVEKPLDLPLESDLDEPKQNTKEIKYRKFKIKKDGKKYNVIATSQEDAETKLNQFFDKQYVKAVDSDNDNIITVSDIFNAILEEIKRIVTKAHPETVNNTYDRWVAVLTEELGEIVHEINDEFEGKTPTKNTFVECVQLCAATVLLAKKFAKDHPEIFEIGE